LKHAGALRELLDRRSSRDGAPSVKGFGYPHPGHRLAAMGAALVRWESGVVSTDLIQAKGTP
jgi:hypothetical protein